MPRRALKTHMVRIPDGLAWERPETRTAKLRLVLDDASPCQLCKCKYRLSQLSFSAWNWTLHGGMRLPKQPTPNCFVFVTLFQFVQYLDDWYDWCTNDWFENCLEIGSACCDLLWPRRDATWLFDSLTLYIFFSYSGHTTNAIIFVFCISINFEWKFFSISFVYFRHQPKCVRFLDVLLCTKCLSSNANFHKYRDCFLHFWQTRTDALKFLTKLISSRIIKIEFTKYLFSCCCWKQQLNWFISFEILSIFVNF